MSSIWHQWRSFMETVDETTSAIRGILGVFVVIGGVVVALGKWLATLNFLQRGGFIFVLVCLSLFLLTYLLDWVRKRSIDSIPELLSKLDQLTLNHIDNISISAPEKLVIDLAALTGIDIRSLISAAHSQDRQRAEQEFSRFANRYDKLTNPKKLQDNLMTLRLMGGLMNDYNAGLALITTSEEYQKIYQRIKSLQKRLPITDVSVKINEYFHQSEGLYSMLLSIKPFMNLGTLRELIPARTRAYSNITRPIIEGHTTTLITAVRESIENYKNKGKDK